MDDDILIEVKLDDREITKQMDTLSRKLQRSLDTALGGRTSIGGATATTRAIKDQEAAAIRLAQAQARLAAAGGNLSKAQTILSTALGKTTKETTTQISAQTQLVRVQNQMDRAASASAASIAKIGAAFSAIAGIGAVSFFERFGRAAIEAAISVDRQVSALTALTGSAAAAEKRFAQLFALAQKTPGLTTSLAATLDAQLRVFDVNVKTIDKLLPVIGRLNAITPLGNPQQFVNNLTQLISQNFERQDLKELVGQSPIAGQLIKQIFNVDNPTNAEAIRASAKKLGVSTVERLAEELIKAGQNNPALRNAVETLGGQFEKLQDRVTVALAPLGKELARTLLPLLDDIAKATERFAATAAITFRDSKDDVIALAREMGNLATQIGRVVNEALQLVGAGSFRDFIRETALMLATLNDLTSGDFGGTRTRNLAQQFSNEDARAQDLAAQRARVNARLPFGTTIDDVTGFLRTPPAPRRPPSGRVTGGGGSRGRTRPRFVEDFGLGQTAELEREIELARIRRANLAVVARRRGLPEGIGLPTVPLTAPGAPGIGEFPGQELALLTRAADELERLPQLLSDSERFMRGFKSAVETTGDAFERFGQNVASAFGNVRDLFNGLKSAVLGFFNDLVGGALQNLVRQTLGGLLGGGGGGGGGILGNLFRTPSTFPAQIAQAFAGDGITAPPSISAQGATGIFANGAFGRGLSGILGGGGGGAASAGSGFSLGGLFGGLASSAPLLGLGLGSGFGGQSVLGQIAGAIGGGAIGLGVSFGSAVFGAAGGGLGALGPAALAALGPIALIGAPLLVGAIFAGKAAQRKKDEQASGEFLTQALQGIEQLAQAAAAGQFRNIGEARSLFESQIIGTFQQQINTLKTKSVRDSRLKNQVNDLRNVFEARIPPIIADQEKRAADAARFAAFDARLIPQFATGGTTIGGLALLHPGEKVLNMAQQQRVIAQSNPEVFERAGVPGPSSNRVFDVGGTMASSGQSSGPATINLIVQVGMTQGDAQQILASAVDSRTGQKIIVNALQNELTRRN